MSAGQPATDSGQLVIESNDRCLRVMVSSTTLDLAAHREQVCDAILRLGHRPEMMEHGAAEPGGDANDYSLRKVEESHLYVGFLAERYGHIPADPIRNPDRLSITELEYRHALRLGKPTLLFLAHDDHPFTKQQMDREPDKVGKLQRLKDDINASRVCGFFNSRADLFESVIVAIGRVRVEPLPVSPATVVYPRQRLPQAPAIFAAPCYISTNEFVGRGVELDSLNAWARSEKSIMVRSYAVVL